MRLILVLLLVSFNALALDWFEMDQGATYTLKQSFQLPQMTPARTLQDFMSGEKFVLKEISPLPIGVYLYIFDYKNCPGPKLTTDMEIIAVNGTNPMVEIGAQLELNCELWIFAEDKDVMSPSFFE